MKDIRTTNRALVRFIMLPTIFLTVALLGGVRVSMETGAVLFIAPPPITLILAVMLMLLFVRGGAIKVGRWVSEENSLLANGSHVLILVALFFASAQAFNSLLPEAGLLRWMFSFFFLWTLWNNQFSHFDARRLVRSLAALFGTAFVLKYVFLPSIYSPGGGWVKYLVGTLLEGVTLGTLEVQLFAPATGFISFFTLALYVCGLVLLPPAPDDETTETAHADDVVAAFRALPTGERQQVSAEILGDARTPQLVATDGGVTTDAEQYRER